RPPHAGRAVCGGDAGLESGSASLYKALKVTNGPDAMIKDRAIDQVAGDGITVLRSSPVSLFDGEDNRLVPRRQLLAQAGRIVGVLFIARLVQEPDIKLPRPLPLIACLDAPVEAVRLAADIVCEAGLPGGEPTGQFIADLKAPFQIALRIEDVHVEVPPAHEVIAVAAADEPAGVNGQ